MSKNSTTSTLINLKGTVHDLANICLQKLFIYNSYKKSFNNKQSNLKDVVTMNTIEIHSYTSILSFIVACKKNNV